MINNLIKASHLSNVKLIKINEKILTNQKEFFNNLENLKNNKISSWQLQQELEEIKKQNINILHYHAEDYPQNFKNIIDPPLVFYAQGNLDLLKLPKVAIVGSRVANLNNIYLAQKLAEFLTHHGVVVVSGFAKGIDTIAHKAAHNNTIAVLGTGLNKLYPKENHVLFKQLKQDALVISEYPINTLPLKHNFPRRNRLIAALADIVIIIEAKYNSGSLITAKYALDYNKEIFAVSGHPFDRKVAGCNQLIKDGANMLIDFDEILELLAKQYSNKEFAQNKVGGGEQDGKHQDIKTYDDQEKGNENSKFNLKILNLLSDEALFPEEISGHLNIDPTYLNRNLAQLELQDKIYKDLVGRVARKFVS